jgi:nitrogenase molybdenum-cofactor synthesis protein NifE
MAKKAVSYSIEELNKLGKDGIPKALVSGEHLIYNSPASLMFNSPGAEGFGVKRAGLAVPDSVMLIVSPGCCARNTSLISSMPEYENRFFYLLMDETDLVTGRHLKKIPDAIEEIINFLPKKPSAVMICITCVDALLGTDMDRIVRKAEEKCNVHVRPCYMYALTREGRKPPMVHVRQSIYTLLEKRKKNPKSVNLLGFFAGLKDDSEVYDLLKGVGIQNIREIGKCRTYEEFMDMGEANFNLCLYHEARFAANDIQERLGIPYIDITRFYDIERIRKQYAALGQAIGVSFKDEEYYEEAKAAIERVKEEFGELTFAIGESINANSYELALALIRYGFKVSEIYCDPTPEQYVYIRKLSELSPETLIFSNLEPTMLYYDVSKKKCDISLGKDASYYQPESANVRFNSDIQPYGYRGVTALMNEIYDALKEVR